MAENEVKNIIFKYNLMVKCMKLSELQRKDIIDINSGVKVGNIIDVNVNESGFITTLNHPRWSGISWENLGKIEDNEWYKAQNQEDEEDNTEYYYF